ncbi:MAG TPA: rRNA pseudouridine synthase [Saprospiraceae bacterium]|nr:rRNA pseudouridine synthase [Saprospiraceae bacterium]
MAKKKFHRGQKNTAKRKKKQSRDFNKLNKPVISTQVLSDKTRLNKYVALSGICSRRKAAELVKEGKVKVNDQVIINPGYEVLKGDVVSFNGKILQPQLDKVYILMNKPKNTITTASDEKGRRTVLDLLGDKVSQRIFPVGRLDRATTGLLLLTNDGDLAYRLSHPSSQVRKIYHATLDKPITESDLAKIKKGVRLEEGIALVDGVSYIDEKPKNIVGIEIHIGWNRIIRRIFEQLNYEVVKLDRVYFAGLTKKDLKRGWFRHLNGQEIIMLKHFTKGN